MPTVPPHTRTCSSTSLPQFHPGRPRHVFGGAPVVLLAAKQEPRHGGQDPGRGRKRSLPPGQDAGSMRSWCSSPSRRRRSGWSTSTPRSPRRSGCTRLSRSTTRRLTGCFCFTCSSSAPLPLPLVSLAWRFF